MKKRVLSVLIVLAMMLSMTAMASDSDANAAAEVMSKKTFYSSNNTSLPYRLYVPDDYNPEKEYSLLLFLHGAGNRGNDNENQVSANTGLINRIINGEQIVYNGETLSADKEFIIVAPQCMTDFQWVDTSWSVTPDPSYKLDAVVQSAYMTAVVELIDDICSTYNIDSSRMYATGLSMGGFGVWDLLMRYPDLFAAAVPMGGAGDTSKANIIKNTPVWTFHQLHDPVVASAGTVAMVKALVDVGAEVKFTPYFDTVHNAWTKGYAEPELLQWLYSHTKVNGGKVAFVGDSITYGAGVANRDTEAFVSIVDTMTDDSYEVANFGVSATSALSSAKQPYIKTEEYKMSLDFGADILFIMFGTNDIKYENWDEGKPNFETDYINLINSYKEVNPKVKVYVGIPPRIFKENVFGERSPQILENEGIPAIYNVAEAVGAEVVDFFNPSLNHPEMFPDYLHPDAAGNKLFADVVYNVIFAEKSQDINEDVITSGASDYAKGEIALSYAAGIMPEDLADHYQQDITRLEFCEMVVNILPENLESQRVAAFSDCDNEAVNYAYSVGLINGVSDTEFAPESKATRQEMATMLYRAYKIIAPEASSDAVNEYPDRYLVSDWALDAVDFMNGAKIMQGDENGNVMPDKNTSCQDAVLLVYRTFCSAYYYGK